MNEDSPTHQQASTQTPCPHNNLSTTLRIVVYLSGMTTGAFFGWVAAGAYGSNDLVAAGRNVFLFGTLWGAATGLLAAIIWCRRISRIPNQNSLVAHGASAGLFVGILSTLLLHLGLNIYARTLDTNILTIVVVVGLLLGILAGAIVGAICGRICQTPEPYLPDIAEPQ